MAEITNLRNGTTMGETHTIDGIDYIWDGTIWRIQSPLFSVSSDATINGSGTPTSPLAVSLTLRKTDLFLGDEFTTVSVTLNLADGSGTTTTTQTTYITAGVSYYFIDGVTFVSDGLVNTDGSGFWTTANVAGGEAFNTANTANLIG